MSHGAPQLLGGLKRNPLRGGPRSTASAAVAGLALLVVGVSTTLGVYDALREQTFDAMLGRLLPTPNPDPIVVVDIDRSSLEAQGAWPWKREHLAGLVADVVAAQPTAVALDILIEGADDRSPAALARRLADITGSDVVRAMAAGLVDGDAKLVQAIHRSPVVLGLALDAERTKDVPPVTPVLVQGRSDLGAIWQSLGVLGPAKAVADAAAGHGVLALAGDRDGRVRRVPLLTAVSNQLRPGLAIETVRVAQQASAYILAQGNVLRLGDLSVAIGTDATLRLVPLAAGQTAARTIPAGAVTTAFGRGVLKGKIVLIGSSAPELGGLRLAGGGDLVASVQLQARATAQLLDHIQPRRPGWVEAFEAGGIALAALFGLLVSLYYPPRRAGIASSGLAVAWLMLSGGVLRGSHVLLDPLAVPITALAAFAITALLVAADARRREAALRRRFEQHLAPELVTRIARQPQLLKLEGETREVTILFTDVEDFTAMTERSDPATLIRVLDRYLDEMSAIIVSHGGMVEKIVGDGFHGLFNAPLDLANHADKGVACALALRAFSERFAEEPEPKSLGFGRTRIGIETGPVIVGDVGGGSRLDYTAYGNAMNTAARLEAANKVLGSAICIGPGAAAQLSDPTQLRPLGPLEVRGRSIALNVADIWPVTTTSDQRRRHLEAIADLSQHADDARRKFQTLADERPDDRPLRRLVERLTRLI